MFKLIKFILWLGVIIVLAYFMTDLKIGGKTIKENIDDVLKSQDIKIPSFNNEEKKTVKKKTVDEAPNDHIRESEKKRLEEILKNH